MPNKRKLLVFLAGLTAWLSFAAGVLAGLPAFETGLNPAGMAFEINPDDQGVLWISDYGAGQVWGFYPEDGYFEVYPVGGKPSDARHDGQYLWWADGESDILGRVSTQDGSYTSWQVLSATGFYGTALDDLGRFWTLEASAALLYRLDPDQAQLCSFSLPDGARSNYLAAQAGYLWLGDYVNWRLLRLDLSNNSLSWWTLPAGSNPFGMAIDGQGNLWTAIPGQDSLARLNPSTNQLNNYVLPQGTSPAMVALQDGQVWYTEQNLASLGRLDPLLASSTVFTPTLGSTTASPTCSSLNPGSSGFLTITVEYPDWTSGTYATLLDQNGWQVYQLPENASPWGIASMDEVWFVDNGRRVLGRVPTGVRVSACKLEDLDGDPLTTADQAPLDGWTVYLVSDGVRQDPGKTTGANGCVTWTNLAPGVSYGVEEDASPGWSALTPLSHSFGVGVAGDSFSHTFVNAKSASVTACSLYDADGDLNTANDQSPLSGQAVYLLLDGVRQQPGLLTGLDGCQTWSDLVPNHDYGLEQSLNPGWQALTPSSISFGLALPGDSFLGTFINTGGGQQLYLPVVQR